MDSLLAARWRASSSREAARVARFAGATWRDSVDPSNIKASWQLAVPALAWGIAQSQARVADEAAEYVSATITRAGERPATSLAVSGAALAQDVLPGVTRSLEAAPSIVLSRLAVGIDFDSAMTSGWYSVTRLANTAVQTVAGEAVDIAQIADQRISGYVRYLVTPSCGRCALLAGRFYPWSAGFQRHPKCDCQHRPVTHKEKKTGDFDKGVIGPNTYFASLNQADQNKYFGKAVAEKVRETGDVYGAVNANRGMYARGGHSKRGVSELNSKRLDYAMAMAGGDRAKAIEHLRASGLIDANNHRIELPKHLQTKRRVYI